MRGVAGISREITTLVVLIISTVGYTSAPRMDKDQEKGLQDAFQEITNTMSADWKDLGHSLKLDYDTIEGIEKKHSSDPKTCCRAVLEKWRRSRGRNATVKKLINAVREAEREDVAERLEELTKVSLHAGADPETQGETVHSPKYSMDKEQSHSFTFTGNSDWSLVPVIIITILGTVGLIASVALVVWYFQTRRGPGGTFEVSGQAKINKEQSNEYVQTEPYSPKGKRNGTKPTPTETFQSSNSDCQFLGTPLLTKNAAITIGTWTIGKAMYNPSKSVIIAKEMTKYKINVLGLSCVVEPRWGQASNGTVLRPLESGETILMSCHQRRQEVVCLMVSKEAWDSLIEWEAVSSRIICATFYSEEYNVDMIQCCAPRDKDDRKTKTDFYDYLEKQLAPNNINMTLIMGDFDAQIGQNNNGHERVMGKQGLGDINENGRLLIDFCARNNLTIGGSLFCKKDTNKATWTPPDGLPRQVDHICISQNFRGTMQNVEAQTVEEPTITSNHHPVIGTLKIVKKSTEGQVLDKVANVIPTHNPFQALADMEDTGEPQPVNEFELLTSYRERVYIEKCGEMKNSVTVKQWTTTEKKPASQFKKQNPSTTRDNAYGSGSFGEEETTTRPQFKKQNLSTTRDREDPALSPPDTTPPRLDHFAPTLTSTPQDGGRTSTKQKSLPTIFQDIQTNPIVVHRSQQTSRENLWDDSSSIFSTGSERYSEKQTNTRPPKFVPGERVKWKEHLGEVMYIGETCLGRGVWVGVKLDTKVGRNDGSVKDQRYFKCRFKHGIFLRQNKLSKASASPRHRSSSRSSNCSRLSQTPCDRPRSRRARRHKNLNSTHMKKNIDVIAREMPADWQQLATNLGLPWAQIRAVDRQHSGDCWKCCQQVLDMWRSNNGGQATVKDLIKAVRDTGHQDVAENLEAMQLNYN